MFEAKMLGDNVTNLPFEVLSLCFTKFMYLNTVYTKFMYINTLSDTAHILYVS